jgi:hypothetical protein
MMQTLFNDILKAFIEWWKKVWFEARLSARLKMIELENQVESKLEREEAAKPIYIEHPVDPELQTGDSQKLGGAMQLTAPWYKDQDASSES